jgi:hypothetical protein
MRTGRPKKGKTLSRSISLRILPEHEATLKSIGGGSVSGGVRTLAENCRSTTGCTDKSNADSIAALLSRHAPVVNGQAMSYRVASGESGWIVVAEKVE